jgi:uncharacterized membrane protein
MPTRSQTLLLAAVSTMCLFATVVSSNSIVDGIASTPIVILLPGATLLSLVGSLPLRGVERLFWSVVASISMAVLGGLVLNAFWSLTRATWLLLYLSIFLVLTPVSLFNASHPPYPAEHSVHTKISPDNSLQPRRWSPLSLSLACVALLLVCGSLTLSQISTARTTSEHFTQLWIVPQPVDSGNYATRFEIGIMNNEGFDAEFVVRVTLAGAPWRHWVLHLHQRASWEATLQRPPLADVSATVAFAASPQRSLSTVHLSG